MSETEENIFKVISFIVVGFVILQIPGLIENKLSGGQDGLSKRGISSDMFIVSLAEKDGKMLYTLMYKGPVSSEDAGIPELDASKIMLIAHLPDRTSEEFRLTGVMQGYDAVQIEVPLATVRVSLLYDGEAVIR
ncbi:MAG: hypothetical protein GOV01_00590 [Candidatus Altiarchaeota archaeon]|nr:hypothetical protein [Candidatus Altiarchaeota archaeon]